MRPIYGKEFDEGYDAFKQGHDECPYQHRGHVNWRE